MDQLGPQEVSLTSAHYQEIVDISESIAPIEACGVIAGKSGISTHIYPITNTLNSPYEYLMDPAEMLKAFYDCDEKDWEVLAFFHSHPNHPPIPSQTDLARNYYPDTPHIILGKINSGWKMQAYLLKKSSYTKIPIVILQDGD